MTELPMMLKHQELIRDGVKDTTLRSKALPNGVYLMYGAHGISRGKVHLHKPARMPHVVLEPDGSLNWTRQSAEGKARLADHEGGYTIAEFEQFMRGFARGMGKRFIEGERNLYLHGVTWLGGDDD
jgi:hypothetical protein